MAPLFYTRWRECSLSSRRFSPETKKNEPLHTTLLHPDLSLNNIMVDPNTLKITGIIDWECTNASPR